MRNRTNGLAIAGLVVSIASLFVNYWGLVSVVGLLLSAIGRSQANRGEFGGEKLAVAGILVGIVGIIYGVIAQSIVLYA